VTVDRADAGSGQVAAALSVAPGIVVAVLHYSVPYVYGIPLGVPGARAGKFTVSLPDEH
jgi:hypothetical protein